jgi:hypothetical protein
MTKTAIIEYNEADEILLQMLFQKLGIQFKLSSDIFDEEDTNLLDALERLENLPDNIPFSVVESKHLLVELKEIDII